MFHFKLEQVVRVIFLRSFNYSATSFTEFTENWPISGDFIHVLNF